MALRLFNTRTRRVEPFRTAQPSHARIYVCGLTPSADGHLGHARSFLFFDVLRRYLEHPRNGYRVTYVQNVTDIDDRSIATAQREGTTYDRIVARYYDAFKASMRKLGVRDPDEEPYATHFIPQIIDMIGELMARGFAYATSDGVYYRVASFGRYGALSGKNIDELLVGARIAENEHKDDPLDFALWKFARPDEPSWPSPWGNGRPGWHIECSAMSRALLGVPFDLHGGGYDLIFPHHENEIAQSEALMDAPPMAEMWAHGGLLNFDGRKMSKSLGNFEPLWALLDRHDPLAIRLLFLRTGYRKPMNFTEESVVQAKLELSRMQLGMINLAKGTENRSVEELPVNRRALQSEEADKLMALFFGALDNDMDTARATAIMMGIMRDSDGAKHGQQVIGQVREMASILGLANAFTDEALRDATTLGGFANEQNIGTATLGASAYILPRGADRILNNPSFAALLKASVGDVVSLDHVSNLEAIQRTIEAREGARLNRDYQLADRLRQALFMHGIDLRDSKNGTGWTVVDA